EYTLSGALVSSKLGGTSGLTGGVSSLAYSNRNLYYLYNNSFSESVVGEYNATTGAPVNASLVDPSTSGQNQTASDVDIAASGSNIYINYHEGTGGVASYSVANGVATGEKLTSGGIDDPEYLAVSGNDVFVDALNGGIVTEYNATTG